MNWRAWHWRRHMRRVGDPWFAWTERRAEWRGFFIGVLAGAVASPVVILYLWLAHVCSSWTDIFCGLAH